MARASYRNFPQYGNSLLNNPSEAHLHLPSEAEGRQNRPLSMRGILITFEGGDGCGKSTQISRLTQRLEAAGLSVLTTREPGGTPAGEAIRHLLQTAREGEALTPEAELLLFAASRAQLVREVLEPALAAGRVVIADRFADSTTVYQGCARRLPADAIAWANRFALGALQPDLTLLLDLEPEAARERLATRSGPADRMEAQPPEFHHAVREGYLALAAAEPGRFRVLDAALPPEALHEVIWNLISEKLHGLHS